MIFRRYHSQRHETQAAGQLIKIQDQHFSCEASPRYLLLPSSNVSLDSITAGAMARGALYDDLFGAEVVDHQLSPFTTAGHYLSSFGGYYFTGSSGADLLQLYQELISGSGQNCLMRQASLSVLRLGTNDVATYQSSGFGTSSSTFQDALATPLTFTPPSAGDYLMIAYGTFTVPLSTTALGELQLWDGTTAYGTASMRVTSTVSERIPWMIMTNVALSGAQTWKIRIRSTAGVVTVSVDSMCVAAIRLDDLIDYAYAEDLTTTTDTVGTYKDKTSLSWTPSAGEWLVLACANGWRTSAFNQSCDIRLWDGTTTFSETNNVGPASLAEICFGYAGRHVFAGGVAQQFDIEFRTNTSPRNVSCKNGIIAALNLTPAADVIFKGRATLKGRTTIK